jgi:ferredoxin-type protein NapF
MASGKSRRELLGGRSVKTVLRPPGALERGFATSCTGCGECAAACPQAIIHTDNRGAVLLDLSRRACTLCGECARACPTGALAEERVADWPWRASVSADCLSLNRTACRACEDACDARAIRFRLEVGGNARPIIDDVACNGCGACIAICPAGAVSLARVHNIQPESKVCA